MPAAQMGVRRMGPQARVLNRRADGEVIQVVEAVALQAEQAVKRVVEIAAEAGRANAGRLRLQVKDGPECAGFPEEAAIPPRAFLSYAVAELRDHAKAERSVRRDLLVTAHRLRHLPQVALRQQIQVQMLRRVRHALPGERVAAGSLQ